MKRALKSACLAAVLCLTAHPALATGLSRSSFGTMPDGQRVEAITLTNAHGVSATIISYGAAIQSVILPDAKGRKADIALGHATLGEYLAKRQFMGASVGRVANRIAGGKFTLDGRAYQVTRNDGPNALHGGSGGFDTVVWQVVDTRSSPKAAEVKLRTVSPDGDQGFPGRIDATVVYRLDEQDQLSIDYGATTDRPTVVSLSNHAYWNLGGEGSSISAMDHILTIPAASYSPVDATLIPTGEFRSVAGTPFDFRTPHSIGERVRTAADAQIRIGRGYDHNWAISRTPPRAMQRMARVSDPHSGRSMELWSDQPGLQFYSGNFLDATTQGKSGGLYRQGDAIVLEPQAFPDTVNRPAFGSVRLDPGQTYSSHMVYKFQAGAPRR
ncbi:MAG TPA: aldose epimerase family protein [Sphingobium sp.]|uniref:aldose epimerase family protein n=1 Tax=Sphingobium sp. TaxID=1912891 RepID=UPI002ED5DC9B